MLIKLGTSMNQYNCVEISRNFVKILSLYSRSKRLALNDARSPRGEALGLINGKQLLVLLSGRIDRYA